MYRVRPGLPADVDAAAAIWELAHAKRLGFVPEGARKERAMEILRSRLELPSAKFRVCEAASRVVGMLLGSQGRAQDGSGEPIPDLLHISYVAVDPDYWKRGIASALLEHLAAEAAADGYACIQLWVVRDNVRARSVYERLGYTASGREKIDDYGEPIVHYARTLRK